MPFAGSLTALLLTALALAASPIATAAGPVTVVPFRWTPGQIEVQVSVNGDAPAWFILDSGAEFSILHEELVRRLGLSPYPSLGRRFARGVSLRLGDIEMEDQE